MRLSREELSGEGATFVFVADTVADCVALLRPESFEHFSIAIQYIDEKLFHLRFIILKLITPFFYAAI